MTASGLCAVVEIVNAEVLRDEPAEWIERQPTDRSFDAALAEFLHHLQAELPAETFIREIPAPEPQPTSTAEHEEAGPAR